MSNILIIEDEPLLRTELSELLGFEDYKHVTVAVDGEDGIEKIKETLPSLILCDIGMPNLDGYGVLKWLRTKHSQPDIPFVFLTAFRSEYNQSLAARLGCNAYITKPYDIDELLTIINSLIGGS